MECINERGWRIRQKLLLRSDEVGTFKYRSFQVLSNVAPDPKDSKPFLSYEGRSFSNILHQSLYETKGTSPPIFCLRRKFNSVTRAAGHTMSTLLPAQLPTGQWARGSRNVSNLIRIVFGKFSMVPLIFGLKSAEPTVLACSDVSIHTVED